MGLEGAADGGIPTVKLSPRIRSSALADDAIPAIPTHLIEPFLTDSLLIDSGTHHQAARIVAAPEGRVLISQATAPTRAAGTAHPLSRPRSLPPTLPILPPAVPPPDHLPGQPPQRLGVFRNAVALKDPATGTVLGYEAQFIGKAQLVHGESTRTTTSGDGESQTQIVPATLDIVLAKEEIRIGDRLLPEPPREWASYAPHAPSTPQNGQVVVVHGGTRQYAGQNQIVVTLNRGHADGLERGHVLALAKRGATLNENTDPARPAMTLPDERNGVMLVFRTFEHLS